MYRTAEFSEENSYGTYNCEKHNIKTMGCQVQDHTLDGMPLKVK